MSVEMDVAIFIAGMAAGIALHRFIMAMVLAESPDTLCAQCRWMWWFSIFPKRKKK